MDKDTDGRPDPLDPLPETESGMDPQEAAEQEWVAPTTAFERVEAIPRRTRER
jgi:hypothetical protein